MFRQLVAAIFGLMFLAFWSSACAPFSPRRVTTRPAIDQGPATAKQADGPVESEVLALLAAHNRQRAAARRPPLSLNARLSAAARVQAKDMAGHSKMSHAGSDGSNPSERIDRQGYQARNAGENVAFGQEDVEAVMTSWMESPPHKKNILGEFTEMGAARVFDKAGVPYWCVDFGRPWQKITSEEAAESLLKAINEARSDAKLPVLAASPVLDEAALRNAKFIAEKRDLNALETDGKTAIQRISEKALFSSLAEGDASGPANAADLVKGWLSDRNQRQNLLGDFDALGIGHASANDGMPYWTVIFGGKR